MLPLVAVSTKGFRLHLSVSSRSFLVPSAADFVAMYPQYSAAHSAEAALFALLTEPEHILAMLIVTERTGLPAVSAVAPAVSDHCERTGGLTPFRKQFAGAVTCCVMLANRFKRTNRKRAVATEGWAVGEVYEAA